MDRPLGKIESAWALTGEFQPLVVVTVLRLVDGPEPETLRRALSALQASQPMLRTAVRTEKRRYYFEADPAAAPIPLTVAPWSGETGWQETVQTVLNQPIPLDKPPLMRAIYRHQPGSGAPSDLILAQHHATLDAASSLKLIQRLLALCAAGPGAPPLDAQPMLPPVEAMFPPAMNGGGRIKRLLGYFQRQMADELRYRRQLNGGRTPPIYPAGASFPLTRWLDPESTTALARACRRRRLTLNSALTTAMLLAVRRHLYQDEPVPMRAITFADLRPYLQPPLSDDALGCCISMLRYTANPAAGADFWGAAAEVQALTTQANRPGDKFTAAEMSLGLMKLITRYQPFRMGAVALSYPGVVDLQPAYGEIKLRGMHAYISNNRLGPEYVAFAKILFEQLSFDILYLDSDMDRGTAEAIADDVCRRLVEASRP